MNKAGWFIFSDYFDSENEDAYFEKKYGFWNQAEGIYDRVTTW